MAMRVGFLSGVELRELSMSRFRPKPMDGRYSSLPGVVNATVSLARHNGTAARSQPSFY